MGRNAPRHRADDAGSVTTARPSIFTAGQQVPSSTPNESTITDPASVSAAYSGARFSESGYSGETLYPRQNVA